MHDSARQLETQVTASNKVVVLLLPEALGTFSDAEALKKTLVESQVTARVLLCLPDESGHEFADMLETLGVETEILLGAGITKPTAQAAFVLPALPSTERKQLIEFALTLSDVVLVGSEDKPVPVAVTAKELGKNLIVPGRHLPPIPPFDSVAQRLDPELPGLRACGRGVSGRLEQSILELLAFNWLKSVEGRAESRKRLRRCWARKWSLDPYFAPDRWLKLAPDRSALSESKIVTHFNALDRTALYGSYVHRDLAWLAHFGAAFAVLAAVAGHLTHHVAWGVVELVTLAFVAFLVLGARYVKLQDRWTACRFGAEQLRIARMSLPLLVLPEALTTTDAPPVRGHDGKEAGLEHLALAEVKQIVRDHGLPRVDPSLSPAEAADWLLLIIGDQITYHNRNHRKLEHAEIRLGHLTRAIFVIAMAAVVAHLAFPRAEWLLYLTAAAPAFAAALHATGTRLGIVHRAALSLEADTELSRIKESLSERKWDSPVVADDWRELRRLAYQATNAMGRETTSWHGLVRRYRDELP